MERDLRDLFKPTSLKRTSFYILADMLLSFVSLYLAYLLRFNFEIDKSFLTTFPAVFSTIVFLKIALFFYFKYYFIAWRYFGLNEVKTLLKVHVGAYLIFSMIYLIADDFYNPFPRSVIVIDFAISFMLLGFYRVSKRLFLENKKQLNLKPTIIIGANDHTSNIIRNYHQGVINYYPIAIFDTNKNIVNTYIHNVKVYDFNELQTVISNTKAVSAIIAKEYESQKLEEIFEKLDSAGVSEIKIAKLLDDKHEELKDISIEDLLARKPKDLDVNVIQNFIKDKVVLVTGAGGSIGSEICRQCLNFGAKRLILVEASEFALYTISEELNGFDISKKLVSVANRDRLKKVFLETRPQIVLHAAAFKHVPMCEDNIESAIENNIIGSKNVIDLSIEFGVEKVVLISTDKAVRPTNVMGTTKRVAELYAQNIDSKNTEITAVRFGNVLGSSGSVIPKFKAQIQKGEPITVTHPDITRYFMLISEACQLVLQAASIAKGGEIFILDMGEPVKIVDLANKMMKLYKKDVGIKFVGLRVGEKLYEELLINDAEFKTKYDSIYVGANTNYDIKKLETDILELISCEDKIAKLKEIVPEFEHDKYNK